VNKSVLTGRPAAQPGCERHRLMAKVSFRLGPFGIDLWTVCDILFYKRSDIAMFKLHPLFVNNSLSNIISIL
jgi:hypothetical protein